MERETHADVQLWMHNKKLLDRQQTYKVMHGERNVIQHFHQQLLSNQRSDVRVPVCQPLPTGKWKQTSSPNIRFTAFNHKNRFSTFKFVIKLCSSADWDS